MIRFGLPKLTDSVPEKLPNEQHPAFQLGTFIATWLTTYEQQLANWLNRAQHRVGFRVRNVALVLVSLFFLLYFIALLI